MRWLLRYRLQISTHSMALVLGMTIGGSLLGPAPIRLGKSQGILIPLKKKARHHLIPLPEANLVLQRSGREKACVLDVRMERLVRIHKSTYLLVSPEAASNPITLKDALRRPQDLILESKTKAIPSCKQRRRIKYE